MIEWRGNDNMRITEILAEIHKQRLELDRQKIQLDTALKIRDQKLKEKQIDTQLQIAREIKNKYDKGAKKNNK